MHDAADPASAPPSPDAPAAPADPTANDRDAVPAPLPPPTPEDRTIASDPDVGTASFGAAALHADRPLDLTYDADGSALGLASNAPSGPSAAKLARPSLDIDGSSGGEPAGASPSASGDVPSGSGPDFNTGPQRLVSLASSGLRDEIGAVLGGKYRILRRLGEGGMGVVYRARELKLDRDVAIKRLLATQQDSRLGLERFLREAKAIARLKHENIVSIHTLDTDEHGPYIVMEYVDGLDLSEKIARAGRFDLPEALRLITGIGRALDFAHKRGIFHRDVKPSNVLVDEEGTAKLLDFGLAKVSTDAGLSQTGHGMGTLVYMAPEQFEDASGVDQRADIYALAKTFYHMLTGERPTAPDLLQLPQEVQPPMRKALQARPEKRQFSVDEFLKELTGARGRGTHESASTMASMTSMAAIATEPVTCPDCKSSNAPAARFCRACGANLVLRCYQCGHEGRMGAKHCSGCGADLATFAEAQDKLKAATAELEVGRFEQAEQLLQWVQRSGVLAAEVQSGLEDAARQRMAFDAVAGDAMRLAAAGQLDGAVASLERAMTNPPARLGSRLEAERDAIIAQRTRLQIAALRDEGERLAEQQDFSGAAERYARAASLAPRNAALSRRRDELTQQHVDALILETTTRARKLLSPDAPAQDVEEAARICAAALEQATDEGLDTLLKQARSRLQDRTARIRAILRDASDAEKLRDVDALYNLAELLKGIDPEHQRLSAITARAAALERSRDEALAEFRRRFDAADQVNAARILRQLDQEFPRDARVKQALRDYKHRQAEAEAHRTTARDAVQRRRPHEAITPWMDVLALLPGDEEATEGLTLARSADHRRRTFRTRMRIAGALAAVTAIAASVLAARHWASSEILAAEALAESEQFDAARTRLEAVPRFLAPARITRTLQDVEIARAKADIVEQLRMIETTNEPSRTAEAIRRLVEDARSLSRIQPPPVDLPAELAGVVSRLIQQGERDRARLAAAEADEHAADLGIDPSLRSLVASEIIRLELDAAGGAIDPADAEAALRHAMAASAELEYALREDPGRGLLHTLAISIAQAKIAAARSAFRDRKEEALDALDAADVAVEIAGRAAPDDALESTAPLAEAVGGLRAAIGIHARAAANAANLELRRGWQALDERGYIGALERAKQLQDRLGEVDLGAVEALDREAASIHDFVTAFEERVKQREAAFDRAMSRHDVEGAEARRGELGDSFPEIVMAWTDRIEEMKRWTITLSPGIDIQMVYIAPGTRPRLDPRNGARLPNQSIEIKQGFFISTTELDRATFQFVTSGIPINSNGSPEGVRLPFTLEQVPLNKLQTTFLEPLQQRTGGQASSGTFRLPTAGQWEFAVQEQGQHNTSDIWSREDCAGQPRPRPIARGSAGLRDMLGNVAEIVREETSGNLLARGGSFMNPEAECHAGASEVLWESSKPDRIPAQSDWVGVRVVWTLNDSSTAPEADR